MDKMEIVFDTIKAYDSVNRADGPLGCVYLTPDGRKCAIGRLMTEKQLVKWGNFRGTASSLKGTKFVQEFYTDLQGLHDRGSYWDVDGLSRKGEEKVSILVTDIENGVYD